MLLEVMTFNIRYDTASDGADRWDLRKDQVAGVIASRRPDVVGLQEAKHHQLQWLLGALPEYASVGVGRDDGQTAGEYAAILYRRERFAVTQSGTFWLSPTPEVPGSKGWGASLPRICTWARLVESATGQAFYHFNTHLDHLSEPARENGLALIAQRIAERDPADPAVLTGDFNAEETSRALAVLLSDGSPVPVDAYRTVHPEESAAGTFHGFSGHPSERIDYVLLSPEWQVRSAEIVRDSRSGRYPSDHFPVYATVAS